MPAAHIRRRRRRATRRSWSRTSRGWSCGASSSRSPSGGDRARLRCSSATAPRSGVRYDGPRWALRGAIQYVRVENLPRGAIGPGLLGNGGAYFFQAAGTFSYQFYLRALSAAFSDRVARRRRSRSGRLSFAPEPTSRRRSIPPSAWPTIGSPGGCSATWSGSLYERAWDGGARRRSARRLAVVSDCRRCPRRARSRSRPTCRSIACAWRDARRRPPRRAPRADRTRAAGVRVSGIATPATCTRGPTTAERARPTAADVPIGTVGASAAGVYPAGSGAWDVIGVGGRPGRRLVRAAASRACRRWSRAGFRWTQAPRAAAGCGPASIYASGDGDGDDDRARHVLPDAAVGRSLRAVEHLRADERRRRAGARRGVEPHRDLARCRRPCITWPSPSTADRWYSGSGATERRGNYFGYQGRDTRGAGTLGIDRRRRGDVAAGALVDAARLRRRTWPAATPWRARLRRRDRLFTATLESRFSF